jgi:hypothetical protein
LKPLKPVAILAIALLLSSGALANTPDRDPGPLPPSVMAAHGMLPVVAHAAGVRTHNAYQAAIDHPEILAAVPCLCGCIGALGNTSNLECYILDTYPDVTLYSTHGVDCIVCQMITEDALIGAENGLNPAQLHDMIEAKYGG